MFFQNFKNKIRVLFKCHRSIDNSFFIFLSCREKAHDNKEFSCENSKPCLESRIMTL